MAGRSWRHWKLGPHRSEQMIDSIDNKTDKETQSPKLQLFKDIMKRETTKTQQQNLFKEAEKQTKKKKNRPLARSSKTTTDKKASSKIISPSDHQVVVNRSQESVGAAHLDSDTERSSWQFLTVTRNTTTITISEHTSSCWTTASPNNLQTEAKSTHSGICPLLNYCRTTYVGMVCTAAAFLTLGTCGYIVACTITPQTDIVMPSIDYLKKRPNLKHERSRKSGLSDFIGLNHFVARNNWEESNAKNGLVDIIGSDYADRDMDRFDSWAVKLDGEPNNKHLKDFYKRLLETDQQIKQLKKNLVNSPKIMDLNPKYQERQKRSPRLKLPGRMKRERQRDTRDEQKTEDKQIGVLSETGHLIPIDLYNRTNPLSIVMEKNQITVEFKNDDIKRKYPKCAHGSKNQKHEDNLKHPYHKNSERLDRILDQIIGSDINYRDSEEQLFKKKKYKCKHPKIVGESNDQKAPSDELNDQTEDPIEQMKKADIIQGNEASNTDSSLFTEVTDSQGDENFSSHFEDISLPNHFTPVDLLKTSTSEAYRVFFGMTTMMDTLKRENKHRSPNSRKLLQVEEDEEKLNLGYEDLKEVLADKVEDHDEQDQQADKREKRQYESYEFMQPATTETPINNEGNIQFSLYNKNWKGAMPLYPDELNVIMSQSGLPGYKKKYGNTKIQENHPESNLHSIEYIDDYQNKFEKLGKVAQAYSDYGVFDGSNSKGSVLDKTHAKGTRDNVDWNPGNAAGDKKLSMMNHELENKPTLDLQRNNQLSKPGHAAGRLKRSVANANEHEAINKIVAIADNVKKENTEKQENGKESLSIAQKNNVEMEGDKSNSTNDEDVNPVLGMIIGMLDTTPALQKYPNSISKNSNATENLGRLSRTLMSFEDNPDNSTLPNIDNQTESSTACLGNSSISSVSDSDNSTVIIIKASTITNNEKSVKKLEHSAKNNTVVKRSVKVAGNPMFWTDIYDDEYGVDAVPFDEEVSEDRKPKRSDLDKKPSSWISKKIRRFSNSFHRKSTLGEFIDAPTGPHRVVKREYISAPASNKKEPEGKINFKALHSNMKEVCKKAIREVQQSDSKEGTAVTASGETGSAASSLMQQLVQLMSDLVDYQVQQRTCRKLPPDLQEFLQWLTAPAPAERRVDRRAAEDASMDDVWKNFMGSEAAAEDPDSSARKYEDMARHIQDLSREYEAMSSSDKNKLTGVKRHLETQLKFLHGVMDENQRKKRHVEQQQWKRPQKTQDKLSQGKNLKEMREKRTFIRNLGKKHTRSTASLDDSLHYRVGDGDGKNERSRDNEDVNVRQKKNLRDVYYKALSDARKLTTVKHDIEVVTSSFL